MLSTHRTQSKGSVTVLFSPLALPLLSHVCPPSSFLLCPQPFLSLPHFSSLSHCPHWLSCSLLPLLFVFISLALLSLTSFKGCLCLGRRSASSSRSAAGSAVTPAGHSAATPHCSPGSSRCAEQHSGASTRNNPEPREPESQGSRGRGIRKR